MIEILKEVREALEKIACLGNGDRRGNSDGNVMAIGAITKLDALIAQRESGDDGLAQQYTKLSAHCAMLEDKLATLTSAIGAKQMSDFVAKHVAPQSAPSTSTEKAEPVAEVTAVSPMDFIARISYMPLQNGNPPIDIGTKLYLAPQSAPSTIPLTDEQIEAIYEGLKGKGWSKDFARAIEAAHKIGAKPC